MKSFKRLINDDIAWVGGLCSGFAYVIGLPTWLIRLIVFISLFNLKFVLLIYVLLWVFVPSLENYPNDYNERCT